MQFLPPSRAIAHFGSANCPAAYQGLKIITSLALRFPDFQREYLFKDKTGEIKVEVDDKKLRGMTVTPETLIRIKGKVDNDWFSIQIDVDSVEIITK